jgi:hypothetical protein
MIITGHRSNASMRIIRSFTVPSQTLARFATGLIVVTACSGLTCDMGGIVPDEGLTITATPTGCGVKVDSSKTISWSVTFAASAAADSNVGYQWFFSDGTSASGQIVVHSFKTASQENAAAGDPFTSTGEHDPVNFDVTLTAGSETIINTYGIPMRGTPDGGPEPDGDVCVSDEGRRHVAVGTQLCYDNNPPASGPHYSAGGVAPVQPGFYDEALNVEQWVHNLEHGSIVLLYDCGGDCSDETKAQLQDLFDSVPASPRFNEKKMVITLYPGVHDACDTTSDFPSSGSFLAISWDVHRFFDSLDTDGILDFYSRHVDHGPEDEPIASGIHNGG